MNLGVFLALAQSPNRTSKQGDTMTLKLEIPVLLHADWRAIVEAYAST